MTHLVTLANPIPIRLRWSTDYDRDSNGKVIPNQLIAIDLHPAYALKEPIEATVARMRRNKIPVGFIKKLSENDLRKRALYG